MRIFVFALATMTALMGNGLLTARADEAGPGSAVAVQKGADSVAITQDVQYVWGGYNYCWYPGGWNGPGWYVCNYGPWVTGFWWGGPVGWHGWRWRGGPFVGRFYGGWHGGWRGPGPGVAHFYGGHPGGGWHGHR